MQVPTAASLPSGSFTQGAPAVTISAMPTFLRPIHEIRWRRFRQVMGDESGALTRAAELLGKSQGHVSHFGGKNPTKPIGDKIAGEIEAAYGLPAGSLDTLNGSGLPANDTLPAREDDVNFGLAAATVAQAEHWVRFEEKRHGKLRPVRRAERLIALCRQIQADGGHLSPEHAETIIKAAQGEVRSGAESNRAQ